MRGGAGVDPPSLDVNYPRNHTVIEKENITLQCKVTASNPRPNITWYNITSNSTELSYGEKLTLTNVLRVHAGKYYCVVTNGIGSPVVSRTSDVNVLYSPSLDVNYPRDNTILEGGNLTLQCKVTAANPMSNITWYSVTGNSLILSYGVNLTFTNISRTQAGRYHCIASNGIADSAVSRTSVINVLYPPSLDPNYPRDHPITEGESISLKCVVTASNPRPNVTWIKLSDPGKEFPRDIKLDLSNVVHGDEGEYRCLVENGVGEQIRSRVARVEVQSRNQGSTEEGENEALKSKRRGLIILLLGSAVAILTTGILLIVIFCVCVHKKSGWIIYNCDRAQDHPNTSSDYVNLQY
ncbi:hypothetical protein ACROYT_G044485 [Oculina patagonica]